ncbi:MAG: cytochrome c biogenesis CcdA family protein [Saccharofermentanales bacterium]
MEYLLSFLEGIITFISPCILPMFPIYLSYFAGNTVETDLSPAEGEPIKGKSYLSPVVKNVLGFVIGFTLVFTALGTFAGSVGRILRDYSTVVNIVGGAVIILFGLHFTGLLKIPALDRNRHIEFKARKLGFFSSVLFGIVFSIGWTPCVGVFLGSALMLAASQDSVFRGTSMLFAYSLGLAVPFLLSAIFIERLKSTFAFIKKHYRVINLVAGILLVIVGIMMMFGWLGYLMALLTF